MNWTRGPWTLRPDLTIRSMDFERSTQVGDHLGCIVADLKPALGATDADDVAVAKIARAHALPETMANAALIAAAPEMFDAIRATRDVLAVSGETRVWPTLDRLRELIDRIDQLH